MMIEYIYGIIFFVMPVVGMFVAVIIGGIRNIRENEALEVDTGLIGRIETNGVSIERMNTVRRYIERKKLDQKEIGILKFGKRLYRSTHIDADYGLASQMLSRKRQKQLVSWLKQNKVKNRKVYFHQRAGP